MVSVDYEIESSSDTGSFEHHVDNIKEVNKNTWCEADVDELKLRLKFSPCIITKLTISIMTSLKIRFELKARDGHSLHTATKDETCDTEHKTIIFSVNKVPSSQSDRAETVHLVLTRSSPHTPIKVVSVILMTNNENPTETTVLRSIPTSDSQTFYGNGENALPVTPAKRRSEGGEPAPVKKLNENGEVYTFGNLTGSPNVKYSSSKTQMEHVKLKDQQIGHLCDHALMGCRIALLMLPEKKDAVKRMVEAMDAHCSEVVIPGVTHLVVDEYSRDFKLFTSADRSKTKIVTESWVFACQEANKRVEERQYLVTKR